MGDGENNKNIFDRISENPLLKKYAKGGGIGVVFAILIAFATELVTKAGLNDVIKWFIRLKSLIERLPNIVIISLVIILCIFAYLYKKIHDKGKFKQKFLKDTKDMIISDPTISNITIQEDNKKDSLSINVQRDDKKNLNTKANSNVIEFQSYNSEVK